MFLMGSAALAANEGEATEGGLYFGAGAGRTYLATGGAGAFTGASENVRAERVSAAKVFLGYQFGPPVALEVTHAWCGTVVVSGVNPAGPSDTLHLRVWTFHVVGTFLKVENVAFQGRIGGLAWRAFPTTSTGWDQKGLGIAAGINLKFDIDKNVAVRADFDVYRNMIEAHDFRWGANVASVNIIGSFK
jgi:hypothetical protein